jgi:hypothetical protein
LLAELARSDLALTRWKPNGKFAPWIFRFGGLEEVSPGPDVASAEGDTSLYRESINKTIFTGRIEIAAATNVYHTPWADLIRVAKASLSCWNVDIQAIWDTVVPAGFLLGFMRRWRTSSDATARRVEAPRPSHAPDSQERELHDQIKAAPSANRQFHASDLCRIIGQAAYDARVLEVIQKFGCPRFAATLAVHGQAVLAGEISL